MLNQINQTTTESTEILSILNCNNDDDTYSIFEVATATTNFLF